MTNQEMKLLHERMKKEDPRLLALMEKCFDAGVLSGKEQAQRTWVGLTDDERAAIGREMAKTLPNRWIDFDYARAVEAKLKERNQ